MTDVELFNVLKSTYPYSNIIVGKYDYSVYDSSNLIEHHFFIAIVNKSYYLYDTSGTQLPLNSATGFYFKSNLFSLKDGCFKSIHIANASEPKEYYDDTATFFLFDNQGNVIEDNLFGVKIFGKDIFAIFTRIKDEKYYQIHSCNNRKVDNNGIVVQNDEIVFEDAQSTEYILKNICASSGNNLPLYINNEKSQFLYWKTLGSLDIFRKDKIYYVLIEDNLCPLYDRLYLWHHGNNKFSLVSRDTLEASSDLNFIKLRIVACSNNSSIHEDYIETKPIPKYVFFERVFLSQDYLIFSRGHQGIIIVDKVGNTTFKSSNYAPFIPDGFSGDYLYSLSQYNISIYDINGQNVANEGIIYCGAAPNLIPRLHNWDKYLTTKSSLSDIPKFGIASVHFAKRVLPTSFDKVLVMHSDIHSDTGKVGYGNDKYSFYAELRSVDNASMCGVFSPNGILIPFGKYDTIVPLYYVDENEGYKVEKAIDAWHCDRAWYERSSNHKYSGWFLCIDSSDNTYLQYYDKEPIQVYDLISAVHPKSTSLYIEVDTKTGQGILSPFGWVKEPKYKHIQKFSTDGSDLFFGSARNFENWVVFRVDNDIIRIKSDTVKQENPFSEIFSNNIIIENLFDSNGEYEFMSYHSDTFGLKFYFRKFEDNSKLGIHVFNACASTIGPYSESQDYYIIGNYSEKDNAWQIDDFSAGRQFIPNRDKFGNQLTIKTIIYDINDFL